MTSRQNLLMIQERERKKQEENIAERRKEKAALKKLEAGKKEEKKKVLRLGSSTAFLIPTVKGHAYVQSNFQDGLVLIKLLQEKWIYFPLYVGMNTYYLDSIIVEMF